jgi:hypothetical protein
MRKVLILAAAAAVSAACHNRNEDQTGAAPQQGQADTTAVVHVIDSTRTGPPGEAGRPGNATVTPDSVPGLDSAGARQGVTDSTGANRDTSLTSIPQDTLGPRNPGAGAIDSTANRADTSGMTGDTTTRETTTPSDTSKSKY